jgi:hypothetical protein
VIWSKYHCINAENKKKKIDENIAVYANDVAG